MRKTKTIKELISHVKIKHDKYADLVWAARKPPIDTDPEIWEEYFPTVLKENNQAVVLEVRTALQKVVDKFPEDYSLLKGENGDFCHGFNSGALAAFRYVFDIIDSGVEHAEGEFPNLDS